MYPVEFKVSVEGKTVEEFSEDVMEIESIDKLVNDIWIRWGKNCDIKIHVWRGNWSN